MIAFNDPYVLLAWLFFGILVVVLGWLLSRTHRDDTLSSVTRPDGDEPPARTPDGG